MVRLLRYAVAFYCLFFSALVVAAVDVRIDRDTLPISDSLRVVFTVEGQAGAPDFSPLEQDFEILGTSQSSSVTIVNGSMEQVASWTVDLLPKRVGQLTLPPIRIGNEQSVARNITVTKDVGAAAPDNEIFLEIEADPIAPYVQAQTFLTVRVFRSVSLSEASLTEPVIADGDAIIERLGEDVAYETTRGSVRFSVVERRYVIFPQRSGKIVIDPLMLEARIGRRGSFFDRSNGRYVRKKSEAIELEVRPIPTSFTGQAWLPAEALQLTEQWPGQQREFRAGEPLTRTLIIKARGLTASQLPEINMGVPDGIRQYPDQPQLETGTADKMTLSSRTETIALIPAKEGQYTLPAIEIPWWNTRSDTLEYARIPERTIQVLPSGNSMATPDSTPAQIETTSVITPQLHSGMSARATGAKKRDLLFWRSVSGLLATLWLVTVAAWLWTRRQPPSDSDAWAPGRVMSQLQDACKQNDPVAAQSALLRWAATRWPGNRINSLGTLASRVDVPLQQELHRLSRALFSGDIKSWDGSGLWQACEAETQRREQQPVPARSALEPLYRS